MNEDPSVELVVEGRPRPVGTLTVARALPSIRRRAVGPFVFLDHFGPLEQAPGEGFDIQPHPHIGLSTVTYLFAGQNLHRDSLGSVQVNRPGELNLMTAGRGIVHSERSDPEGRARGGTHHGIQLWLGLPVANEEDAPSFVHRVEGDLPRGFPAPGVHARVIMGSGFGLASPVKHPSQPLMVDLVLDAGARLALPADAPERAVFVVEGRLAIGDEELGPDHLAVLRPGASPVLAARTGARAILLGGPPLDGPRFLDWNFVSSSKERLARAVSDWKARAFPPIPGDDIEFVPYPDPPGKRRDASHEAPPMNTIDCESEKPDEWPQVVRTRSHVFHADALPPDGTDSAPGPHDYFDASLATCKSLTALWYARRHKIPLERVEAHVERDASKEREGQYGLRVRVAFHGPLSEEQRNALFQAIAACPIHKLMTTTEVKIETTM